MKQRIVFFIFLLLYLLLSLIFFTITSGGWASLGIMLYGLGFSIFLLIFTITLAFIFRKREITPSLRIFAFVLFFQTLSILFNVGDGGDGPGTYVFIDSIIGAINPGYALYGQDSGYPWYSSIFMLAYILFLALFVISAFLKGTKKDAFSQQIQINSPHGTSSNEIVS